MVLIAYYIAFCLLCFLLLLAVMRRDRGAESRKAAVSSRPRGNDEMTAPIG